MINWKTWSIYDYLSNCAICLRASKFSFGFSAIARALLTSILDHIIINACIANSLEYNSWAINSQNTYTKCINWDDSVYSLHVRRYAQIQLVWLLKIHASTYTTRKMIFTTCKKVCTSPFMFFDLRLHHKTNGDN